MRCAPHRSGNHGRTLDPFTVSFVSTERTLPTAVKVPGNPGRSMNSFRRISGFSPDAGVDKLCFFMDSAVRAWKPLSPNHDEQKRGRTGWGGGEERAPGTGSARLGSVRALRASVRNPGGTEGPELRSHPVPAAAAKGWGERPGVHGRRDMCCMTPRACPQKMSC